MLLRMLKDIMLNGKFIRLGEYMRTKNPKVLLRHGYARHLNTEEDRAILGRSNEYARQMFRQSPNEGGKKLKKAG